jgi:hypothetical protein
VQLSAVGVGSTHTYFNLMVLSTFRYGAIDEKKCGLHITKFTIKVGLLSLFQSNNQSPFNILTEKLISNSWL